MFIFWTWFFNGYLTGKEIQSDANCTPYWRRSADLHTLTGQETHWPAFPMAEERVLVSSQIDALQACLLEAAHLTSVAGPCFHGHQGHHPGHLVTLQPLSTPGWGSASQPQALPWVPVSLRLPVSYSHPTLRNCHQQMSWSGVCGVTTPITTEGNNVLLGVGGGAPMAMPEIPSVIS